LLYSEYYMFSAFILYVGWNYTHVIGGSYCFRLKEFWG
jgi:hypothetical protein